MQATPQRTAAVTISRADSQITGDGGVRGSVDHVVGSVDDLQVADNVSRPPSFASTQRWWPSGPDATDPDGEPSTHSLPQLTDGSSGWGAYIAHLSRASNGVDVDISQPLLENHVFPSALHRPCCVLCVTPVRLSCHGQRVMHATHACHGCGISALPGWCECYVKRCAGEARAV